MNFEYIGWTAEIPDFGKLMLEDELSVHVAFRDFLCSIDCSKWRKNFDVSDTELQSQLGNCECSILVMNVDLVHYIKFEVDRLLLERQGVQHH